jgi:hypothetical protein
MVRIVLLAALVFASSPALAGPEIGGVSRIAGSCRGELDGRVEALNMASPIALDQKITTAAASRLEITFDDKTKLTLGEHAQIRIDRFVYDPDRSRVSIAVTGAMRFVSSAAKAGRSEVAIRTPVATVGVRGTEFWSGPIDGQYGFLLIEGAVVVSNPAGEAVLDEPGEGVSFAGPGAAPGAITQWPQGKVDRALAAVAF